MSDPASAVAAFFAGHDDARRIFDALSTAIAELGPAELRFSKSQVAFTRGGTLARVWRPDQYLGPGHAPLVLTLGFRQPDPSTRWKEIVEPAPGRFVHHLELWSAAEVDGEVTAWLRAASEDAARPKEGDA